MEKHGVHLEKLGKMIALLFGAFFSGLIAALLLSFLGYLVIISFPAFYLFDPVTYGYILGYVVALPFGIYLISRAIYKRNAKLWVLFLGSLIGLSIFLSYAFFISEKAYSDHVLYWLFHVTPWAISTFFGIIFLPKIKKQKEPIAENPETEE